MSKNKFKAIYIVYLVLAVFTFLYVKNVVERKDVAVRDIQKEEQIAEVKNITSTLEIDDNKNATLYKFPLKSTNTIENILQEARNNKLINYEKTVYLNKIELTDLVSHKSWHVYFQGNDVTNKIEEMYLEDGKIYVIK